jgi:hypothetical protein
VLDGITHNLLFCYQHNGMDCNEYNIKLHVCILIWGLKRDIKSQRMHLGKHRQSNLYHACQENNLILWQAAVWPVYLSEFCLNSIFLINFNVGYKKKCSAKMELHHVTKLTHNNHLNPVQFYKCRANRPRWPINTTSTIKYYTYYYYYYYR